MNQGKSVRTIKFKHQRSYNKLKLHSGMAPFKYSYALWALFGVFIVSLWTGLYVGYVLPVENTFPFKETTCKTASSKILPAQYDQQCECRSKQCSQTIKTYPCLQIFVNYTVANGRGAKQNIKKSLLYYTEAELGKNCSYTPSCEQAKQHILEELEYYKSMRTANPFKCYYNKMKFTEVIHMNFSERRLAILVPFAAVLIVLLVVLSYLLYRRGCGCNAKRRPSRLSFLYNADAE